MKRSLRILLCLATVVASLAGTGAAQDASGIKNLKDADLDLMNNHDPSSELENFELLDGYQANLFAADPMLANPVHMHWDSRGRLWVACSWAYPQLKPGEVANDKIIILEDTDNDGAADKSTVFADGLYLPTGIELANGGCYVAQSPDVFFLKDTDGDDVADEKELVLTGFGIEDSHHSISAWRRGPGGWIYFQEGIFLHAQVETQYGVLRNFNGGVYQFNPRTLELRMFCRGTGGNPWGHVFDRWGQSFMVNNPRILYLSPASGNSGEAVRIAPLISTEKQCGGDLATGSHVGDDIRGQLLTGRFKSRTVVRYEFIEDGAGFRANVLEPLIKSKHPNFRPVDVKIGPDGAVYVADWYNSIINHAQHDFRDPRRDHDHGRIWRITHKQRPLVERPKLHGATIRSLVNQLKSPEDWIRHQARKELSERDPDRVLAAVEAWVESLSDQDPDYDHHLVEAMWACQNVERVSEPILARVLDAKDGHARSAGARVIRYWHAQLSDPIAMVAKASADAFPRTRMEAVLSAGFIPSSQAFLACLNALDHPRDELIDNALSQTMKALENHWHPAMESGELQFAKSNHRDYVEQGLGIGLGRMLADLLKQKSPSLQSLQSIQAQLIKVGTEDDIRMIVTAFTKGNGIRSDETSIAMLQTLQQLAKRKGSTRLRRIMRGLRTLLDSDNEAVRVLAANNLGAWRVAGRDELAALQEGSHSPAVKQAIAVSLAQTSAKAYTEPLANLAADGDLETRYAAVAGLAHIDLDRAAKAAATLMSEDPGRADPVTVVQAFLNRQDGGARLGESLADVTIHPLVIDRVSQFHRESGLLSDTLEKVFQPSTTSGSLTNELLAEDIETLAADAETLGNAARGELIYRRKSLSCTQCHAIGPAGPIIGPNLVAVGAAAKTKYLVESILSPNAAIAEHYETKAFLLDSGNVRTGIVTFRNEQEVVLRDSSALGQEVRLATDEIEAEIPAKSLMPAGLADQLKDRSEFLDLVKFISVLGKPGDYANDESPVIRKWRVLAAPDLADPDQAMLPDGDADWFPAYSMVRGELPVADWPDSEAIFARGFVNVLVPGDVQLDLNSSDGLGLWVDAQRIDDLAAPIHLERGRHAITFSIDRKRRDEGLRVELKTLGETRLQPEGGL